ncbi:MAG TPA: S16 family serine protease [Gaiellaceae bacterium]|nr:S16 family serine protease [Gaiellaceae bacterium]
MRGLFTPWRALGTIVALLAVTVVILLNIQSSDYLLLPDIAHPVAPLVKVQGGHPSKGPGGIYFVDVIERRASELEKLFPWIHSDATLVPAKLLFPPGTSSSAAQAADLREMRTSQQVAAVVALRRLGYHVVVRPNGVIVNAVDLGTAAYRKLQPTDVIIAIDGKPTPTIASLRRILAPVKPGDVVHVRIRRGGKVLEESLRTVNDPQQPGHALIGFEPDQSARIKLPIRVSIDAGNVGGPSAGLAFALEVMEQLGRNVDRGHLVAATGEMELNGVVAPIGGVKQKVFDARKAKVDVFLVPAGQNARDARRYAGSLRIIPVRTFGQALQALATLPLKG